jgi:stage V sporulation protein B
MKDYIKLTLAVIVTGFAAYQGIGFTKQMSLLPRTLVIAGISMGIYLCCLIFLSLIRKEDVHRIPVVGKLMALLLPH